MYVAFNLAKLGYYGSNPEAILKAPVDIVIGIIRFEAEAGKRNQRTAGSIEETKGRYL